MPRAEITINVHAYVYVNVYKCSLKWRIEMIECGSKLSLTRWNGRLLILSLPTETFATRSYYLMLRQRPGAVAIRDGDGDTRDWEKKKREKMLQEPVKRAQPGYWRPSVPQRPPISHYVMRFLPWMHPKRFWPTVRGRSDDSKNGENERFLTFQKPFRCLRKFLHAFLYAMLPWTCSCRSHYFYSKRVRKESRPSWARQDDESSLYRNRCRAWTVIQQHAASRLVQEQLVTLGVLTKLKVSNSTYPTHRMGRSSSLYKGHFH